MIKLEQNALPDLGGFFDRFSATKIKANELAYGFKYPFLLFWCQYIESALTAVICKFEQSVILVTNKNADINEIKQFINAVGFTSLEGEYELVKTLTQKNVREYTVVFKKATQSSLSHTPPNIKQVYEIIYGWENEHIATHEFEPFYADLTHRIRHGTAAAVLVQSSAAAIASHITGSDAVISGVATIPNKQGKGLGRAALETLEQNLVGRNIFASADSGVLDFYLKSGYIKKYKIAICEYEEKPLC